MGHQYAAGRDDRHALAVSRGGARQAGVAQVRPAQLVGASPGGPTCLEWAGHVMAYLGIVLACALTRSKTGNFAHGFRAVAVLAIAAGPGERRRGPRRA